MTAETVAPEGRLISMRGRDFRVVLSKLPKPVGKFEELPKHLDKLHQRLIRAVYTQSDDVVKYFVKVCKGWTPHGNVQLSQHYL